MLTLTTTWFRASDAIARLLAAFALIGAVAYPFIGPVYLRAAQQPITALTIAGTSALWLAVAVGALAIGRRKATGIFLVLLPAVMIFVSGQTLAGLTIASGLVLVFSTPFLLAFFQARANQLPGGSA